MSLSVFCAWLCVRGSLVRMILHVCPCVCVDFFLKNGCDCCAPVYAGCQIHKYKRFLPSHAHTPDTYTYRNTDTQAKNIYTDSQTHRLTDTQTQIKLRTYVRRSYTALLQVYRFCNNKNHKKKDKTHSRHAQHWLMIPTQIQMHTNSYFLFYCA